MIKTIILLIITYIFNLIDYAQTICAISHFGLSTELNPIVRFLFKHNCIGIVKIIVPIILLTALGFIIKAEKENIWMVYFIVIFYFLVILHNFAMLIQMGIIL
jgi:hypothetical protein